MKSMNCIILVIGITMIFASFSFAMVAENDFTFEVRIDNPDAIICEPIDVRIIATYKGAMPIELYESEIWNKVFVNDKEIGYNACNIPGLFIHTTMMKKLIKQSDTITMIENLRCYPPFWKAGKYNVRIEKKINDQFTLKSPSFYIKISEPTGIDKELYDYAQSINPPDLKICSNDQSGNCKMELWSPCATSGDSYKCFEHVYWGDIIATKYPNSCYTAWIYNGSSIDITNGDPRATVDFIKKNKFWLANSVPFIEAKDKWKRIRGPEYAKWENMITHEILTSCPRFPRKDKLAAVSAVNNIALGKEAEGIRMLKVLIQTSNSREAIWAKQFLEEWEKQRPRQ